MTEKIVRQRHCYPTCNAISVVKMKKDVEWHCERCGSRFLKPSQREYEYKFTRMPPILQNIMKKKEECHGKN